MLVTPSKYIKTVIKKKYFYKISIVNIMNKMKVKMSLREMLNDDTAAATCWTCISALSSCLVSCIGGCGASMLGCVGAIVGLLIAVCSPIFSCCGCGIGCMIAEGGGICCIPIACLTMICGSSSVLAIQELIESLGGIFGAMTGSSTT